MRIVSDSSDRTEHIGALLARNLRGGEVIDLQSDLGGGKTTFVKGIASGIGITEPITSPTFTVSREYNGKNLKLVHFDLYRIGDPSIVSHIVSEAASDKDVVTCIEWSGVAKEVLPNNKLTVKIEKHPNKESHRVILLSLLPESGYLLKGLSL